METKHYQYCKRWRYELIGQKLLALINHADLEKKIPIKVCMPVGTAHCRQKHIHENRKARCNRHLRFVEQRQTNRPHYIRWTIILVEC